LKSENNVKYVFSNTAAVIVVFDRGLGLRDF